VVKHHLRIQSDEALMVLIQDHHSHAALIEIHRRYSSKLLGYFFKMLNRNESLAQDFVQELFLKLLEKKHLYDSNRKFYTWVFTVASNMCKTEYRSFGKTVVFETDLHSRTTLTQDRTDKSYFLESLQTSLDTMETVHKNVLILRYLEEFSLNEIADILDISLGTVKSRLFYATKKLTEDLKEFDPSFQQNVFKLM
jgi:RNA polymerase sigma-70 factor, ECF subfamily